MIIPILGGLSFNRGWPDLLNPGRTKRSVRNGWRGLDYLYPITEDVEIPYTRLYNFWMDLDAYVHKSRVIALFTIPPLYRPSDISPYLDIKDWRGN